MTEKEFKGILARWNRLDPTLRSGYKTPDDAMDRWSFFAKEGIFQFAIDHVRDLLTELVLLRGKIR